ncbi:hypothetical protein PV326_009852 [Microctonus aethiopoides]|uniref:RING-type domain-containing protein n=1 Tax=Microctonus aethiopoides TaxID=144406 RepID=A0AA39KKN7_9HYME|nr:hypothetical protein PV326_009852 [Microctonus aethiopoides]KAK0164979.1 hypothetical protein PV328_003541 [Microctonus aethiopoides]
MSNLFAFTTFYGLFAACVFYPPKEFVSMGFTISELASLWLGQELDSFIQYHIKRSIVTLMVHSLLPFGYVVGLAMRGHIDAVQILFGSENPIWLTLCICTLIGPMYTLYKILTWSKNNWSKHPIAKNLSIYCAGDENRTWTDIASNINREFMSISKLQIATNTTTKVVVTDNWIMQVSPYKLDIAYQANSSLVGYKVDIYQSTTTFNIGTVYAKYRVCTRQPGGRNFTIRLNFNDMENFTGKILMPITTEPSLAFPKTMKELWMDEIKQVIADNPVYISHEELEKCAVCINATSNIKLIKRCPDIPIRDDMPLCKICNCPPRSCIDCLVKWFIAKSVTGEVDQDESFFQRKSSCPQCRSTFCLLDISYVKYEPVEPSASKS